MFYAAKEKLVWNNMKTYITNYMSAYDILEDILFEDHLKEIRKILFHFSKLWYHSKLLWHLRRCIKQLDTGCEILQWSDIQQ